MTVERKRYVNIGMTPLPQIFSRKLKFPGLFLNNWLEGFTKSIFFKFIAAVQTGNPASVSHNHSAATYGNFMVVDRDDYKIDYRL